MSDAQIIDGAGPAITLDGRDLHLRYNFRSIAMIETKFGSLQQFAMLQDAIDRGGAPVYGAAAKLLACGLLHEHDGSGAPLTEDRLLDLLDSRLIGDYFDAATTALAAAFPAAPEGEASPPDGEAQASPAASPGAGGTSPRRSRSAAATTSSG